MQRKNGFTVMELMVVIFIIGAISSIILVGVNKSKISSRDAKRVADLTDVSLNLELYFAKFNKYPSSVDGDCVFTNSFLPGGCLEVLVTNGFMAELPSNPDTTKQYYYDNWCRVPSGTNSKKFRMWTNGELNHNGLAQNWWNDQIIGATTCQDPS